MASSFSKARRSGLLVLFTLLVTVSIIAGAASASATSRVQPSLAALQDIPVMAPPVEDPNWHVTYGVRHFVFDCPDGFPGDRASLDAFVSSCTLVQVMSAWINQRRA